MEPKNKRKRQPSLERQDKRRKQLEEDRKFQPRRLPTELNLEILKSVDLTEMPRFAEAFDDDRMLKTQSVTVWLRSRCDILRLIMFAERARSRTISNLVDETFPEAETNAIEDAKKEYRDLCNLRSDAKPKYIDPRSTSSEKLHHNYPLCVTRLSLRRMTRNEPPPLDGEDNLDMEKFTEIMTSGTLANELEDRVAKLDIPVTRRIDLGMGMNNNHTFDDASLEVNAFKESWWAEIEQGNQYALLAFLVTHFRLLSELEICEVIPGKKDFLSLLAKAALYHQFDERASDRTSYLSNHTWDERKRRPPMRDALWFDNLASIVVRNDQRGFDVSASPWVFFRRMGKVDADKLHPNPAEDLDSLPVFTDHNKVDETTLVKFGGARERFRVSNDPRPESVSNIVREIPLDLRDWAQALLEYFKKGFDARNKTRSEGVKGCVEVCDYFRLYDNGPGQLTGRIALQLEQLTSILSPVRIFVDPDRINELVICGRYIQSTVSSISITDSIFGSPEQWSSRLDDLQNLVIKNSCVEITHECKVFNPGLSQIRNLEIDFPTDIPYKSLESLPWERHENGSNAFDDKSSPLRTLCGSEFNLGELLELKTLDIPLPHYAWLSAEDTDDGYIYPSVQRGICDYLRVLRLRHIRTLHEPQLKRFIEDIKGAQHPGVLGEHVRRLGRIELHYLPGEKYKEEGSTSGFLDDLGRYLWTMGDDPEVDGDDDEYNDIEHGDIDDELNADPHHPMELIVYEDGVEVMKKGEARFL